MNKKEVTKAHIKQIQNRIDENRKTMFYLFNISRKSFGYTEEALNKMLELLDKKGIIIDKNFHNLEKEIWKLEEKINT